MYFLQWTYYRSLENLPIDCVLKKKAVGTPVVQVMRNMLLKAATESLKNQW